MAIRFHPAGKVILSSTLIIVLLFWGVYYLIPSTITIVLALLSLILAWFNLQFFRYPNREKPQLIEGALYAPADGKVVVIENTQESKYFGEQRIQVSIFMSPLNVHVNWTPCAGRVISSRIEAGKYLFAANPKSSELNERSEIVIERPNGTRILVKQIAGVMARRILNFTKKDQQLNYHDEIGFIKFGSRVDLLLPTDADIHVNIGDVVTGSQTLICILKN